MSTPPPPKNRNTSLSGKTSTGKGEKSALANARAAAEKSYNETAGEVPDIDDNATYRIAAIGFSDEGKASALDGALERTFEAMFRDHESGPRLALFSGVLLNTPWSPEVKKFRALAREYRAGVLFERRIRGQGRYLAYTSAGEERPVSIVQRFVSSAEADAYPEIVDDLAAACQPGGSRTIVLEGVPIGFLVCGENNLLANVQSEGNRTHVRHHDDGMDLFGHVPVVFNGAHTNMGNWGKLERRFEYLSRGKRWAFYATNLSNNDWGVSTARLYHDGHRLIDSSGKIAKDAPRGVRVQRVRDDENDVFIAVAADIPGRLLARAS